MRKGTTPVHVFNLPFHTEEIAVLKITYSQRGKILFEKRLDDCTLEGNTVTVPLSQEDTFKITENTVEFQLRIKDKIGKVHATKVFKKFADECLDEEVL